MVRASHHFLTWSSRVSSKAHVQVVASILSFTNVFATELSRDIISRDSGVEFLHLLLHYWLETFLSFFASGGKNWMITSCKDPDVSLGVPVGRNGLLYSGKRRLWGWKIWSFDPTRLELTKLSLFFSNERTTSDLHSFWAGSLASLKTTRISFFAYSLWNIRST